MNDKHIKKRLVFRYILVFALSAGLFCLGFVGHAYRLRALETERMLQSMREIAERDLAVVHSWLDGNWDRLEALGTRLQAGSTSEQFDIAAFLHTEIQASPYDSLVFFDEEGGLIGREGAAAEAERWPEGLEAQSQTFIFDSGSEVVLGLLFTEPISWQGHLLAGVAAQGQVSLLLDFPAARNAADWFSSSLLYRDGRVLAGPAECAPDYGSLFAQVGGPDTDAGQLLSKMGSGETLELRISVAGTDYELYMCPVTGTDWYVAVSVEAERAAGQAQAVLPVLFGFCACWLFIFALLMLFLLRPLQRMQIDAEVRADELAFLTSLNQELRAPLSGIAGQHFLMRQNLDEPVRLAEYMDKADHSAEYLRRLVSDLLDIYRFRSGQIALKCDVVYLTELLDDVDALVRVQAEHRQLSYRSARKLTSPWVYGDRLRLRQLLVHLLENAAKFTPPSGLVQFRSTQHTMPDGRVETCFSISDTGVGMSEAFLSQIWMSDEQERPIGAHYGAGLGAPLCRTLTEYMGGTLEVTSKKGSGSTFTLRIPFKAQSMGQYPMPETYGAVSVLRKRILVAEDNAINRELVVETLQELGCSAVQAINGQDAVHIFENSRQNSFDLILMDIQMPVMDGYRATREIRALNRQDAQLITIVALTANVFHEEIETALKVGMDDVLTKPLAVDQLVRVLRGG